MNNFKISKITKFNILSLDQSYLKERLWKVTRFLFLYGVSVFLWGCEEVVKEVPPEVVIVSVKDNTYILPHMVTLREHLSFEFDKIIVTSGSVIKLNNFDLTLKANKLKFKGVVHIVGFHEHDYNLECESHGLHSGSLIIKSKVVEGSPFISLKGQNSGRHGGGYYIKRNKGKKHHPEDKVIKGYVRNPCKAKHAVNGKTVKNYWRRTSFNGGNNGDILISENSNIHDFNPDIIKSLSRGNLFSYVGYSFKTKNNSFSFSAETPEGLSGALGQFCIISDDGFKKCFDDFIHVSDELNSLHKPKEG